MADRVSFLSYFLSSVFVTTNPAENVPKTTLRIIRSLQVHTEDHIVRKVVPERKQRLAKTKLVLSCEPNISTTSTREARNAAMGWFGLIGPPNCRDLLDQ